MAENYNLLAYFGYYVISVLITYSIGLLFTCFYRKFLGIKYEITDTLFWGLLNIVMLFALYKTKCNTIFLLPLFSYVYLIIKSYLKEQHRANYIAKNYFPTKQEIIKSLRELLSYTPVFVIFFIVSFFLFIYNKSGFVYVDYTYYSNVSNNLSTVGVESLKIFTDSGSAAMPYHFFELWLNSFFATVFKSNHLHFLLSITYPLLFSVVSINVYKILRVFYQENKIISTILTAIFPLIALIEVLFGGIGFLYNPKVTVIYLLLTYGLYSYLSGNYIVLIVSLILSVAVYTPVSPAIYGALFFIAIFVPQKYVPGSKEILLVTVIASLFVVVFYFTNTILVANKETTIATSWLYENNFLAVKWFFMWVLKSAIILLPAYFVLYFISLKKIRLPYTVVVFVIVGVALAALFGAFLRLVVRDGGQIFTNFAFPVFAISLFLTLLYVIRKINSVTVRYSLLSVLFIVYLFVFIMNKPEFFPNAQKKISKEEHGFLMTLTDINEGENIGYYRNHKITNMFREALDVPLKRVAFFNETGRYAPYWLSVFDIPIDEQPVPAYNDDRRTSELYKFIKRQNIDTNDKSMVEQQMLQFIKLYNIVYVVVEQGALLPQYLNPYVKTIVEHNQNYIVKIDINSL